RWCLCGFLIPAGAEQAELPAADHAAVFDNHNAPLHTFHAKIVMGYSLGIYGQVTREDLHRMRLIRNAFAHSPRAITFDTPAVTKLCLELYYLDYVLVHTSRTATSVPVPEATNPRDKLLDTARLLIIDLHAIGFLTLNTQRVSEKCPNLTWRCNSALI